MADNDEWVEDVRRWCMTGAGNTANRSALGTLPDTDDGVDIGYEAAHPSLQSLFAPDSSAAVKTDPL